MRRNAVACNPAFSGFPGPDSSHNEIHARLFRRMLTAQGTCSLDGSYLRYFVMFKAFPNTYYT